MTSLYNAKSMTSNDKRHQFFVFLNFALVYIFWGSTYLAIRVVVTENIPPTIMGTIRFAIAGGVMLIVCAALGKRIWLKPGILLRLGIIGCLLLTTGNVVLGWGEQFVPSGLAALLLATTPLWIAFVETVVFRGERLRPLGMLGLATGIVGLTILMWPKLSMDTSQLPPNFLFASGILLLASLSWSVGSVFSHRWDLPVDPFVASAWEMFLAGIVNSILAFTLGDHLRVEWTIHGVEALAYLIVAGSWIGFTAYIWLLKHVPTAKVATFAYVNPIVAVFLGWLFLNEAVDIFVFIGATIIVGSVWLVNASKVEK